MAEKKSVIEEALLDIANIQSALNANTKEILRSVAREEIDSVVKESLNKEVYEEEDLESMDSEDSEEVSLDDMGGSEEVAPAMDAEIDPMGDIAPEEGSELEPEMGPEMGMDASALGGEEMDMTAASDDDVIAIYKKMTGEDEIEIVGDEIHLNVSEPGEYVIKPNATSAPAMGSVAPEMDMDDTDVDYEIEMGDDEVGDEPTDLVPVEDEAGEEESEESSEEGEIEGSEDGEEEVEELEEQIPVGSAQAHHLQAKQTKGVPLGAGADNLRESTNAKLVVETKKKYNTLLTEAKKLKTENEEFRKALKTFRNKLVETVVFNSNLTYVTRLFMEHATTKGEKQNIIKRFDTEVSNLLESKKLYKTIANELETRKPINESIEKKIIKEVGTGASKQLTESTAYVDPSTKRILDLIQRVENK